MAKRRQSSQSVRRSAKRREEEARQRRNRGLMWVGIAVLAAATIAAIAVLLPLIGSDSASEQGGSAELPEPGPLAAEAPADRNGYFDQAPEMIIDTSKEYEAVIRTEKGDMRLRLFAESAPLTVNNFVFLARQGFYDGTIFHRVIQDFMAQGGDPTGTGGGGPGYQFEDETDNGLVFDRPGLLAMANRGSGTNGSQFFITYVPTRYLDGRYTIFGELVEGEEVLNSLSFVEPGSAPTPQGDLIERIAIIER